MAYTDIRLTYNCVALISWAHLWADLLTWDSLCVKGDELASAWLISLVMSLCTVSSAVEVIVCPGLCLSVQSDQGATH